MTFYLGNCLRSASFKSFLLIDCEVEINDYLRQSKTVPNFSLRPKKEVGIVLELVSSFTGFDSGLCDAYNNKTDTCFLDLRQL